MTPDQTAACIRITDHGEAALWLLAVSAVVIAVTLVVGHVRWMRRT